MIKVILVDDHSLILRGLRELLSGTGGIEVIGQAGDYGELRNLLRRLDPDVVVLDINLPGRNGFDALASLRESHPRARALVLSQYAEDQYGLRALKAGAMGYLNKACDPALIVQAIQEIAAGRSFTTDALRQLMYQEVAGNRPDQPHDLLSEREMQVMLLIAAGRRLSQIAEQLSLSPKTVSVYRARVLEKLSLTGNAEIAAYALRHGLID